MKKSALLLSTILAINGLVVFSGCGVKKSDSKIVTINAFNSYFEAQRADYRCMTGEVDLYKSDDIDGQAVRLKIESSRPLEWETTQSVWYTPRILFQAVDEELGYDLRNASSVSSFSVDVGNENDYDATVVFWIEGKNGRHCDSFVDVPANTNMTAVFPMNPLLMKGDAASCVRFAIGIIDKCVHDESGDARYTFDNFQAEVQASALNSEATKTPNGDEIISFKSESDVMYVQGANVKVSEKPTPPAGGVGYVKDTPIGNALKLTFFGKNVFEGWDLTYYTTNAEYYQMYGAKINDDYLGKLNWNKLQQGYSMTAQVFNNDTKNKRNVYLVLADKIGNFARGCVSLEPMNKGKIVLNDISNLKIDKIDAMYIAYDTYNLFERLTLYVNDIRFEKEP